MAVLTGASGVTTFCAGLVQDFLCARAPTPPPSFWLALGTAGSAAAGITELAVAGYARQLVTPERAANGRETNATSITFGPASGSAWSIGALAIFNGQTGGEELFVFVPSAPIEVPVGQPLTIDINALSFGFGSIS